jgi:hypothetical protein
MPCTRPPCGDDTCAAHTRPDNPPVTSGALMVYVLATSGATTAGMSSMMGVRWLRAAEYSRNALKMGTGSTASTLHPSAADSSENHLLAALQVGGQAAERVQGRASNERNTCSRCCSVHRAFTPRSAAQLCAACGRAAHAHPKLAPTSTTKPALPGCAALQALPSTLWNTCG